MDVQVITVEEYRFIGNEIEAAFGHAVEYFTTNYIHNTKFFTIAARNDIFSTCDQIRASLIKQWNMHIPWFVLICTVHKLALILISGPFGEFPWLKFYV